MIWWVLSPSIYLVGSIGFQYPWSPSVFHQVAVAQLYKVNDHKKLMFFILMSLLHNYCIFDSL